MRLTLVITTYERPDALAAVLASVGAQREPPDEILVADDGSTAPTREVVAASAAQARRAVLHVRQAHAGFRLTRLRNLATARSSGDYLVFVDGDMVLHRRASSPTTAGSRAADATHRACDCAPMRR